MNVAIAVVLVVIGVGLLPVFRPTDPGAGRRRSGLLDAGTARAHRRAAARSRGPDDRLFNPQPWGSWFEYALPDVPIAVDSRIELFPAETWSAYLGVLGGRDGWQGTLENWEVTLAAVRDTDPAFVDRLRQAGWQIAFEGSEGTILVAGR